MTPITTVLFDMDGVLIDAKEWHYEALNKALGLFGMEISRYDHLVTYDGLPTRRKLEMLTLERGLPKELHGFINSIKQKYTLEQINEKCKPMFIHEYALSRLRAEGFVMGVCSNSIRQTIEAMLDKAMIRQYFDVVMSNEDVTRGKPDPEMYIAAMARLGVTGKQTLICEDNLYGIQAATASGAHVLAVQGVDEVNYGRISQHIHSLAMEAVPC